MSARRAAAICAAICAGAGATADATATAHPTASANAATASAAATADAAARQERFLALLRTYPSRPPPETFAQVAALIDEGPFPEHDRAEYWLGSARLAAQDREGARAAFARLERDHPQSAWVERSALGLGDAAGQERRYGLALRWYTRAGGARDPAVRELARISVAQTLRLRARQRWAWGCGLFYGAVALAMLARWARARAPLFPLPAEVRIAGPVLAVIALLSIRQDAAPREAILELCGGAALLLTASALRLRADEPAAAGRAAHACVSLAALAALGYVAVYRGDLVGMVLETLRQGPE